MDGAEGEKEMYAAPARAQPDDRRVWLCVFLQPRTRLVRKTSVSEYQSLRAGRCLKAADWRSVLSQLSKSICGFLIFSCFFSGMIS